MHLKESAYNFIYDDLGKDQIVFYNSRTGALAVVHEDQYASCCRCVWEAAPIVVWKVKQFVIN